MHKKIILTAIILGLSAPSIHSAQKGKLQPNMWKVLPEDMLIEVIKQLAVKKDYSPFTILQLQLVSKQFNKILGNDRLRKIRQKCLKEAHTILKRYRNLEYPLHEAIMYKQIEIAKYLMRSFDITAKDDFDRTPLHWAALSGNKMIVESLVESGVPMNSRDKAGWTPLQCALLEREKTIATFLIDHGAKK